MIGLSDKQVLRIVELLEQAGVFDSEEIGILEDYLSGEKDRQVLEKIKRRDMSQMPVKTVSELRSWLWVMHGKKQDEFVGRLGNFLFAAGGLSSENLFHQELFTAPGCRILAEEPAKLVALYSVKCLRGNLVAADMHSLAEMAGNDPETVKRAREYLTELPEGEILLLAVYFQMRYPRISAGEGGVKIEPQDAGLLERYEGLLADHIKDMFDGSIPASRIEKIKNAVRQDKVDDKILGMVAGAKINHFWYGLLAGTGFINYELSSQLKNLVSICFAADTWRALETVEAMDMRGNLEAQGGRFDEIFGVDSLELIRWAQRRRKKEILAEQFNRNGKAYLLSMDKDQMDISHYRMMSDIIKEEAPEVYEERRGKDLIRQRGQVTEEIVKNLTNDYKDAARAYLSQNAGTEVLYAGHKSRQIPYNIWGYGPWEVLENYRDDFGCDSFVSRCEIVLMFYNGFKDFPGCEYVVKSEHVDAELVKNLFRDVDGEKLSLARQLGGYENIVKGMEDAKYIIGEKDSDCLLKEFADASKHVFGGYLEERRDEMIEVIRNADIPGRCLGAEVYAEDPDKNKEEFLELLQDRAKAVRDTVLRLLCASRSWEKEVLALLASRKAADRTAAIQVLTEWNDRKYLPDLNTAYEKEKGSKVQELLETAIENLSQAEPGSDEGMADRTETVSDGETAGFGGTAGSGAAAQGVMGPNGAGSPEGKVSGEAAGPGAVGRNGAGSPDGTDNNGTAGPNAGKGGAGGGKSSRETAVIRFGKGDKRDAAKPFSAEDRQLLVRKLHKGNRKRTLEWAYDDPFPKVHFKEGGEADQEYMQAILLGYSSAGGASPEAAVLAEALDAEELAAYMDELFDRWMEAGAEVKKRWVMYAAAIHGGAGITERLRSRIQEWPREGRSAIAAEAARALSFSPDPDTLFLVDELSRKAKHEPVRAAAVKALNAAEIRLGTTIEALMEKNVPDFGFDENIQRVFDYGTRKFTVTVTIGLEIEVSDEKGKKLKNLPAPGKRDDEEKAAAAYEEFKAWKKKIKTAVSEEKKRLERAVLTGRKWDIQAWKDLFVKNPIMHQFAIGLVWGIYEDGKLITGFRYMDDGSFNTENEEVITLPDSGQVQAADRERYIRLLHPIDLSEKVLEAWKNQLADYEITQPVEQLIKPIYHKTEEEMDKKELDRFAGSTVNDLSLGSKLISQGWRRGPVEGGGKVYVYYREDREMPLGAVLYFSGSFLGTENVDVTVEEVKFYHPGNSDAAKGSREAEPTVCPLKDVPDRYFSEVVLQVSRAVGANA